jgi:DNA-binding transcriptional regulator YdaS (Cro superfamily)
MNLRDYLKAEGLTQEAFAKKLSPPVSQGKVNHWLSGSRRVSLAEALQIEQITGGAVTLHDMVAMRTQCHPREQQAEAA